MTTDKNRDGEKQAVVTGLMGFDGWCKAYPERLAVLDKNDPRYEQVKAFEKEEITSEQIQKKLEPPLDMIRIYGAEKKNARKINDDFCKLLKPASELKNDGVEGSQWESDLKDAVSNLKTALMTDDFCKKYINALTAEQTFEIKQLKDYPNYKVYYPLDMFNKLISTLNAHFGAEIDVEEIIKASEIGTE